MDTYKITFELHYPREPGDEDDINISYVLADSFEQAERKVLSRYKTNSRSASVISMELIASEIIV